MKKHIATTVDADLLAGLNELAAKEETSIARILRRGARRELDENRLLKTGRTRAEAAAGKRKMNRGRVAAAA